MYYMYVSVTHIFRYAYVSVCTGMKTCVEVEGLKLWEQLFLLGTSRFLGHYGICK